MLKEGLSYFSDPAMVMAAFLIFLFCFIGIVVWTYRKSGKGYYDEIAQIPLREQHTEGGRHE